MYQNYDSSIQYQAPLPNKTAVLKDRLYVPSQYVTASMLEAYEHLLEVGKDPLTDEPVIQKYSFYEYINMGNHGYYAFSRGNLRKIKEVFQGFNFVDQRQVEPMRNRLLMKFPQGMNYRSYQYPAIETFNSSDSGLIKAPPRSGKTLMMTSTICLDGQKTLVLAHQTDLLVQLYDTIEKFTNVSELRTKDNPVVGFPTCLDDFYKMDVCLCTKQTFDHMNNKDLGRIAQKLFGSVLVDECFPYYQNVLTEKGPRKIGAIYNAWKKGEETKVLSYNEETKIFEYKRVTHAWKREPKDILIEIRAGSFRFKCTADHLFLTARGWVKACELTPKDYLVGYNTPQEANATLPMSSGNHLSLVVGSFLGDGGLSKHQQGFRLRFLHGHPQKKYLEWKASLIKAKVSFVEENGYSKKPAHKAASKLFYLPFEVEDTKHVNLPEGLLNHVDAKALAIWYMDDGSFDKVGGITLHTESFSKSAVESLKNLLLDKFGIKSRVTSYTRKERNKEYNLLKISLRDCGLFMSLIAPYCLRMFEYKFLDQYKGLLQTGSWEMAPFEYFTKVTYTKELAIKKKDHTSYLFDLEVEDNHTFVIGNQQGVVVHNCHWLPGPMYSHFVNRFDAKYRRGVTATPARKDGLQFCLFEIIGPIVYEVKRSEVGFVPMEVLGIKTFIKPSAKAKKYADVITDLCNNDSRNRFIAAWMDKDVKDGKTIFAVTDRKDHTTAFANYLKDMGISAQAFNGRFTQKATRKGILDNVRNGSTSVLVAMRQMATGLDIPRADTFYNLTPSSNAVADGEDEGEGGYEQQCTRILTPFEGKKIALVRDFMDDFGAGWAAWTTRKKTYNKLEARIRVAADGEIGKSHMMAPIQFDYGNQGFDTF